MRRPRLVDPFSGAGGASRGYQLVEAIPPYMTEHLGAFLLEHLASERAA